MHTERNEEALQQAPLSCRTTGGGGGGSAHKNTPLETTECDGNHPPPPSPSLLLDPLALRNGHVIRTMRRAESLAFAWHVVPRAPCTRCRSGSSNAIGRVRPRRSREVAGTATISARVAETLAETDGESAEICASRVNIGNGKIASTFALRIELPMILFPFQALCLAYLFY